MRRCLLLKEGKRKKMKINEEIATCEFHIKNGETEIIGAVRKPNADTKITHAFYFKGLAKDFRGKDE